MNAADELKTAAQTLLDLADETDTDIETNTYWHSELTDRPHWYANGIDNALGGPAGKLSGLFSPAAARELAKTFRAWARMGEMDPDLLHRVGGAETLNLARSINAGGTP